MNTPQPPPDAPSLPPTPRTIAEERSARTIWSGHVHRDFAIELECDLSRCQAALAHIAEQHLTEEMDDHTAEHADYEDGYNAIVNIARKAIEAVKSEIPAATVAGEVTCNPPLDCDRKTFIAYIKSMKDGERITVLGRCCEEGMQGTVVIKDHGVCIKLDPYPSGGQMTVSFLGGARRLTDVFPNVPDAKEPPVADSLRETPRTDKWFDLLLTTIQQFSRHEIYPEDLLAWIQLHREDARTLERELSEWEGLAKEYFQVVPGERGEGEEIPGTPDSIRAAVASLQDEWDSAERRLTAAQADSKRLEWLIENCDLYLCVPDEDHRDDCGFSTREEIDAAMREG